MQRRVGSVFSIEIEDQVFAYGKIIREPYVKFYNIFSSNYVGVEEITKSEVAFTVSVMNNAFRGDNWKKVGIEKLSDEETAERKFFSRDLMNGKLRIHFGHEVYFVTKAECEELEPAVVWDRDSIEDRLRHFRRGDLSPATARFFAMLDG